MNVTKMRRYVLGQNQPDAVFVEGFYFDAPMWMDDRFNEIISEAYALNALVKVAWAKAEGNLVEIRCETVDTTSGVHEYKTIVVCKPGDISPWEIGTFEGLSFYQAQQLASRVVLLIHGYDL